AKTLVSQAIGANDRDELPALCGATIVTAAALGLVTLVLGQLTAHLLVSLSATPAAGAAARTYMRIRSLSSPMALVYVAMREIRYGEGDSRSPMIATVIANAVNIVLAILFLFVLRMGVAGAALATVIAHTVELGVLATAAQQPWRQLNFRWRHVRE